jgi:hypothetical protein
MDEATHHRGHAGRPVTVRAVALGLALLPLNAWWLTEIEFVRYSDTPTIPQVFFHCVAALVVLRAANLALERWWPRRALSMGELLTVYTMLVIGSNVASHDQLAICYMTIVYVFGRATPSNQWETVIWPHLPRRVVVTDRAALEHLLKGHSSAYLPEHWAAFRDPLLIWGVLALVVAGTMYCLATLLRRQWDHERLTYPLAEIPLAVADPAATALRAPAFWGGFALAAGLQLLNLAHQVYPAFPSVNLGVRHANFADAPWRYANPIPICFYPFAFGLSFLLPTNLSFSCWFFFLFTKLERVVAAALGHTAWDGPPYINQQWTGAFIGLGVLTLWTARRHLAATFQRALGRDGASDAGESLRYRTAWLGLLGGLATLQAFAVAAGMQWEYALAYWALLFCIVIAVARIRAEVGLPSIELYQRGPDDVLRRTLGGNLRPADLTVMTLFFWLHRTHRNYNMQHQMDGVRLASRASVDLRSFTIPVVLATVFGIIAGFWAFSHVLFQVGLEGAKFTGPAVWAFGNDPWQQLARRLTTPQPVDPNWLWAYLFGGVVTALLVLARQTLLWWPLHPAGWVVSNSFALQRIWVPIFLTWAIKSALLRYGGLKAYRQALPFFLGLAIGEFSAGLLRTLVDLGWELYLPSGSGIGGL